MVASIVLAVAASAAHASAAACRAAGLHDAGAKLALARVATAEPKLNFVAGPDGRTPRCPSADGSCKRKAFVLPGDDVLLVVADGPYVCAAYRALTGVETAGWLPRAALQIVPLKPAAIQQWAGTWRRDADAELVLKPLGALVKVSGDASSNDNAPGGPNVGELDGKGTPQGQALFIGYDPGRSGLPPAQDTARCAARLRLYGRYLIVEDSGGCGGMNVTFKGVYIQVPSHG